MRFIRRLRQVWAHMTSRPIDGERPTTEFPTGWGVWSDSDLNNERRQKRETPHGDDEGTTMEGFILNTEAALNKLPHDELIIAAVEFVKNSAKVAFVESRGRRHHLWVIVGCTNVAAMCTGCGDVKPKWLKLDASKIGDDDLGRAIQLGWKLIGHPQRGDLRSVQ